MNTVSHESELGVWESARAVPAPPLRHAVREYVGWWEHTAQPLLRRELPSDQVPLIINFGAPVRVFDVDRVDRWHDFDSFSTGVYDRSVLVGTAGPSGGVQVNLTIAGARLFLARPLDDLFNRAVSLTDVMGRTASLLAEELFHAASWRQRFEILDREFARRLALGSRPPAIALRAYQQLALADGNIAIHSLAGDAGCSQKHLIATFRREFGLTPKRLARVLRFGRAVEQIKGGCSSLAALAAECGYYDQAHFDRDFKVFAGATPGELIRRLMPDGAGFLAG